MKKIDLSKLFFLKFLKFFFLKYMNFISFVYNHFLSLKWFTGTMQSRETTLQVFPPTAASEGPALDQWAQPFGPEECSYVADEHGSGTVCFARTNTNHSKHTEKNPYANFYPLLSRVPFNYVSFLCRFMYHHSSTSVFFF